LGNIVARTCEWLHLVLDRESDDPATSRKIVQIIILKIVQMSENRQTLTDAKYDKWAIYVGLLLRVRLNIREASAYCLW
jgi:hypothetical protein